MCSILGQITKNFNKNKFDHSNSLMSHRGPDNCSTYSFQDIHLAHNRLSIIDLDSHANQPFLSFDNNFCIVFNGEIYNYLEIKSDLLNLGYKFRTNSDTEVLINGYIEWKEELLNKLNGMFAFAILDKQKNEIFIARDRAGVKPLYYYLHNNEFIFSSEIDPIVELLDNKVSLDEESIDIYYSLGYIPSPKTIYKEIKKFPQASYSIYKNSKLEIFEYWRPTFERKMFKEEIILDEIENLLKDSISLRVRSDVPIGAFLSGGIDSSLIVAYMKEMGIHTNTYTIGFREKEYDESVYAQNAANTVNANFNLMTLDQSNFKSLNNVIGFFGEPFADASAIPTYYVSKFASKDVKVVLSGDGGDELFMGYNSNKSFKLMQMYRKVPYFLRKLFENVLEYISSFENIPLIEKFKLMKKLINDNLDSAILTDINKKIIIKQDIRKDYHQYKLIAEEWIEAYLKEKVLLDDYERIMYNDFFMQLPDKMLAKVDRMSMAHSIEVRNPFLDYRLIEYAFSLSYKSKMPTFESKYLLKKLSEKFYSKDFIYREKSGFVPPIKYWINDNSAKAINSQDKYIDLVYKIFIKDKFEKNSNLSS